MNTGISIYFLSGMEKNERLIKKAIKSGVKYAFTSLHIPEETGIDYRSDVLKLLSMCREGGLNLIVDVGPETLEKFETDSIAELKELGITHVRLDYGFDAKETVEISKDFYVVFNASTIMEEELMEWKKYGADFARFTACHNFYPKQFTALSLKQTKEMNQRLQYLGFTTMAFVPGNLELRGPLFEGLPTVEEHRGRKDQVLLNMLELFYDGSCDVVLIGDVDVEERDWKDIQCLSQDYVELKADILSPYEFVRDIIHHDRPDSSGYVIRSQESRQYKQEIKLDHENHTQVRKLGSISISNENYLRYMGELEIARVDLPGEDRVNIIGQVHDSCMKYLPYIQKGLGVKLI
ncbi:MupG family TIM beta-alpha barrel fold protein [Lacrimispora sp.]|uniref:MupG family TIM beta-alpha barrel fold protein n=1 Tax=Lacrimispora sp. TaxID=2719234 RepID=UPI0028AB9EAF|nr:MupG family TIM beta-alpha barrel fold protein [Lacrimispora sp.]